MPARGYAAMRGLGRGVFPMTARLLYIGHTSPSDLFTIHHT